MDLLCCTSVSQELGFIFISSLIPLLLEYSIFSIFPCSLLQLLLESPSMVVAPTLACSSSVFYKNLILDFYLILQIFFIFSQKSPNVNNFLDTLRKKCSRFETNKKYLPRFWYPIPILKRFLMFQRFFAVLSLIRLGGSIHRILECLENIYFFVIFKIIFSTSMIERHFVLLTQISSRGKILCMTEI